MITEYTVTGMTCEHCVKHVTEEVSAIPGVTDVQVSLAGDMKVVSDDAPDFAAVQAAVAEAGDDYTVALK
jgi:copper chaperone CopZ